MLEPCNIIMLTKTMEFLNRLIEFENSEKNCGDHRRFRIEINECEVISENSQERCLLIFIHGLDHPSNNNWFHYYGDETHNPQLNEAVSTVEKIFDQWKNDLISEFPCIAVQGLITPVKNSFEGTKQISIRLSDIEDDIAKILYDHIEVLIARFIDAKTEIEQAIADGWMVEQKDPNREIHKAFIKSVCAEAVSGAGKIDKDLLAFAGCNMEHETDGDHFYPTTSQGIRQIIEDHEELRGYKSQLVLNLN